MSINKVISYSCCLIVALCFAQPMIAQGLPKGKEKKEMQAKGKAKAEEAKAKGQEMQAEGKAKAEEA